MRIAFVCETYSPGMGYLENYLPKFLANLGNEVHIVTTSLPPYHYLKGSEKQKYKSLEPGEYEIDGCKIHVLAGVYVGGFPRAKRLIQTIIEISPDVIQSTLSTGWISIEALIASKIIKKPYFTESHMPLSSISRQKSVSQHLTLLFKRINGYITGIGIKRCFAITKDCAEVAVKYLSIPKEKVVATRLGVDIDVFFPLELTNRTDQKARIAERLHLNPNIFIGIYTGKLIGSKRVDTLIKAIEIVNKQGIDFSCIIFGEGPESYLVEESNYAIRLDYIPHSELSYYYQALDIGIWPGDETVSVLDALACGLPTIISTKVKHNDHILGNGSIASYGDAIDLANKITEILMLNIAESETLRQNSRQKIVDQYSWSELSIERMRYYQLASRR